MFVISALTGILFLVGIFIWLAKKKQWGEDGENGYFGWMVFASGAVAVITLIMSTVTMIPAGERGVIVRFNTITGVILQEGLQFKSPIDGIVNFNVQTQLYQSPAEAASKDLQDVEATVAINYKVDPTRVAEIYQTLGIGYMDKIAPPAVQEVVKAVTAKYTAEDMVLKREDVRKDIATTLSLRLAERGIITEIVNITNFEFSEEFTKAIEAKVVALQDVIQAQNKLERVKVEAQQAEAAAIGQANAAIAAATGQARSIQIVTDAQVEANKKLLATLTPEMLQYIFIDRLGQDIKVVVVPSGQNLVLPDYSKQEVK